MFDRFKENHGGQGPLQVARDIATGTDWRHVEAAQNAWTATFDAIKEDPELSTEFKARAAATRAGHYDLPTAFALMKQVQETASGQKVAAGVARSYADQLGGVDVVSPEDEKTVSGFHYELDRNKAMAQSLDPSVREKGNAGLAALGPSIQAYTAKNEEQRIANDTLRNNDSIAGEKLRFDRDMDLSTKLSTTLKPMNDQLDALHVASALNTDPKADNIQRALAFNQLVTALDPGGRRDPDGRYAGANGIAVQLQNAYDRALGNPDADAFKAVNEIIRTAQTSLLANRDRSVETARRQTLAYGGDPARVLSVVADYKPPQPTDNATPAPAEAPAAAKRDPSLVEKGAAAAIAGYGAIPDAVKESTGLAAAVTSPSWVPWLMRGVAANPVGAAATAGVAGLTALTALDPRQGLAVSPSEIQTDGTVRGVYVPRFLRKRLAKRNTDEYAQ